MHMELLKNNKYKLNDLRYNFGYYDIPNSFLKGVAVDIGSNNGSFLEKYKNNFVSIHAYEPNIFLVNLLKNKYNDQSNIKIFNEAVDKNCNNIVKLIKHKHTNDDGSFAILNSYEINEWDENEIICECRTVDFNKIVQRAGGFINVLKIDCETSEYNLLMNNDLSNIELIIIEIHHQLGEKRYYELINFISQTHNVEKKQYQIGCNHEFTFINKNFQ